MLPKSLSITFSWQAIVLDIIRTSMINYFPKSKMAAKSVWLSNGIFLLNAVLRVIQYFIGFLESHRGSDQ